MNVFSSTSVLNPQSVPFKKSDVLQGASKLAVTPSAYALQSDVRMAQDVFTPITTGKVTFGAAPEIPKLPKAVQQAYDEAYHRLDWKTQDLVDDVVRSIPMAGNSLKVKIVLYDRVTHGGEKPNEVRKWLESEGIQYLPHVVPPAISAFVTNYYGGIPAAGVIKPEGATISKDSKDFTFNRVDRVTLLYRALADFLPKNPQATGNDIIQLTADMIVAVEDIAFEKAKLDRPKVPRGHEFVQDERFMEFRTGIHVKETGKPWIFKLDHGHLKPIPLDEQPSELPNSPDYVRLIPSTGEITAIRGNGAMLIHRTYPHLGRFDPYNMAVRGQTPDLNIGYDAFSYPKENEDALGRPVPTRRHWGEFVPQYTVGIHPQWRVEEKQDAAIKNMRYSGEYLFGSDDDRREWNQFVNRQPFAVNFFSNRYTDQSNMVSVRDRLAERDKSLAEGACSSGCPSRHRPNGDER